MHVASKVLMNKLVHIIIITVFTSLCYAYLVLLKVERCPVKFWCPSCAPADEQLWRRRFLDDV